MSPGQRPPTPHRDRDSRLPATTRSALADPVCSRPRLHPPRGVRARPGPGALGGAARERLPRRQRRAQPARRGSPAAGARSPGVPSGRRDGLPLWRPVPPGRGLNASRETPTAPRPGGPEGQPLCPEAPGGVRPRGAPLPFPVPLLVFGVPDWRGKVRRIPQGREPTLGAESPPPGHSPPRPPRAELRRPGPALIQDPGHSFSLAREGAGPKGAGGGVVLQGPRKAGLDGPAGGTASGAGPVSG